MAADLTLGDFVGLVKEVPAGTPFQGSFRAGSPFAAVFRRVALATPEHTAEFRVMTMWGHSPAHLAFLKTQFPSLRRLASDDRVYAMNDRDYALMRIAFGGVV